MVEGLKELREAWYYILKFFSHHCIRQQRPEPAVALLGIKEQTHDPDTSSTRGIVWVCGHGQEAEPGCANAKCHACAMQQCQGIVCSLCTVSLHLHHTQAAKTAFTEEMCTGQYCNAVTSPFRKSDRFIQQYLSSCNSETDRIIEYAPNLQSSWSTGMWRYIIISQKALMGTVCLCNAMHVINLHCRAECGPVTLTRWMQLLKWALWFSADFGQGFTISFKSCLLQDNIFICFWFYLMDCKGKNCLNVLNPALYFHAKSNTIKSHFTIHIQITKHRFAYNYICT